MIWDTEVVTRTCGQNKKKKKNFEKIRCQKSIFHGLLRSEGIDYGGCVGFMGHNISVFGSI